MIAGFDDAPKYHPELCVGSLTKHRCAVVEEKYIVRIPLRRSPPILMPNPRVSENTAFLEGSKANTVGLE